MVITVLLCLGLDGSEGRPGLPGLPGMKGARGAPGVAEGGTIGKFCDKGVSVQVELHCSIFPFSVF